MKARLNHHVGLRVDDIERSTRFWVDALDGEAANEPVERTGGYFDQLFGPGARLKVVYVTFDAGAVELFEFTEPRAPVRPSDQAADGLMHFGVHVDDVDEALACVEAAGGKRRLEVQHMGGLEDAPRFVYVESPDGHVFELMEADTAGTVAVIRRMIAGLGSEASAGGPGRA